MPEGDSVHRSAERLHAALAGSVLTRTDFRVPRFATTDLGGRMVDGVDARGKHILIRIDGGVTVHSHFAMDGEWRIYRAEYRVRARRDEVRAVLETPEHVCVGTRLAILEVIETTREGEAVGHLGPDPLRADWDLDEAVRRTLAHPDMAIGDAIIDQRIVAGLGNVYRNEVLFLSGLDPSMPVADVDARKVIALGARAIQANRHRTGHITTGDTRRGRTHWVYGRRGQPCLRCGTPIERTEGARVTYRCPSCQPAISRAARSAL